MLKKNVVETIKSEIKKFEQHTVKLNNSISKNERKKLLLKNQIMIFKQLKNDLNSKVKNMKKY